MGIFENIELYKRIDLLIRMKATGNPAHFSQKLGMSESNLYRVLFKMKEELGCPIEYSKYRKSYVYKFEGYLQITLCFKPLKKDDLQNLKGGKTKKNNLLSKNESKCNYFCNSNYFINLNIFQNEKQI